MDTPLSPVFDFSAVPRFRHAPTIPKAGGSTTLNGPHLLDRISKPSHHVSWNAEGRQQAPPLPAQSPFFRNVTAGDVKRGDVEGARDDELFAADLLRPRPIPPKTAAVSTSDPVEAIEDGAYERDGVALAQGAQNRRFNRAGASALSNGDADIYSRVSNLLRQYSLPVPKSFDESRSGPSKVSDNTVLISTDSQSPVQKAVLERLRQRQPEAIATLPDRVSMFQSHHNTDAVTRVGDPALIERIHASHTSPRPKLDSLLDDLQSTLMEGTDTHNHFEARRLLAEKPAVAPISSNLHNVTARMLERAASPSAITRANTTAKPHRYQHVQSKYMQAARNRAASVEPAQRVTSSSSSGMRASSGRATENNRSSSVPRNMHDSRASREPLSASTRAKSPQVRGRQQPAQPAHQQQRHASSVVKASSQHNEKAGLEESIDELLHNIAMLSANPKKIKVHRRAQPAQNNAQPAKSNPSVDLKAQLLKKQAELRTVVHKLQTTESEIQMVNDRRAQVEELMKALVSELQGAIRNSKASQDSALSPDARALHTSAETAFPRPRTPPIPPALFPGFGVNTAEKAAATTTAIFNNAQSTPQQHSNTSSAGQHHVSPSVADAAAKLFFPLPEPTTTTTAEAKPPTNFTTHVQDLVNFRMQMVDTSLSRALKSAGPPPPATDIQLPPKAEEDSPPHVTSDAPPKKTSGSLLDELTQAFNKFVETDKPAVNLQDIIGTSDTAATHTTSAPSGTQMQHSDLVGRAAAHMETPPKPMQLQSADVQSNPFTSSNSTTANSDGDHDTTVVSVNDTATEHTATISSGTQQQQHGQQQMLNSPQLGDATTTTSASSLSSLPSTAPGALPPTTTATSSACVQCEANSATRRCHECGDDYCGECFALIHKAGKRKEHLWTPFSPTAAKASTTTTTQPHVNDTYHLRPSARLPPGDGVTQPRIDSSAYAQQQLAVPHASSLSPSAGYFSTTKGSLGLFRKVNEAMDRSLVHDSSNIHVLHTQQNNGTITGSPQQTAAATTTTFPTLKATRDGRVSLHQPPQHTSKASSSLVSAHTLLMSSLDPKPRQGSAATRSTATSNTTTTAIAAVGSLSAIPEEAADPLPAAGNSDSSISYTISNSNSNSNSNISTGIISSAELRRQRQEAASRRFVARLHAAQKHSNPATIKLQPFTHHLSE